MCVHVDDERYEGTRPTKQKAKYHAAKAALQKAFHANLPEETGISDHDPVENLACLSAGVKQRHQDIGNKNAIMALHEIRPSARFSLLYETGKEHQKFFTMCVHVDDERYEGAGPTKQMAKYHAAKAALQKAFHANFPDETGVLDIGNKNPIMALHKFRTSARFSLLSRPAKNRKFFSQCACMLTTRGTRGLG